MDNLPKYTFTYRRRFSPFTRSIKGAVDHSWNEKTDKMFVMLADGGKEILSWSKCAVSLGPDYIAARKEAERRRLEAQVGK